MSMKAETVDLLDVRERVAVALAEHWCARDQKAAKGCDIMLVIDGYMEEARKDADVAMRAAEAWVHQIAGLDRDAREAFIKALHPPMAVSDLSSVAAHEYRADYLRRFGRASDQGWKC